MSDLDDIYSDLSDHEDNKKQKDKPAHIQKQPSLHHQPQTVIKMPDFLGGKAFIPPPPPPTSKPTPRSNNSDEAMHSRAHHQNYYQQAQRERKNMIYIKNIPKNYNRQQTLTTFFRTYGNIKSIKTNEQNYTAFVRFQKEQDAFRFIHSKPLILNRSYIVYDTNQDFKIPPEKIAERQKQQNVPVMLLKENAESLLADKYRCLLFLYKHRDMLTERECLEIEKQMDKCRKIKQYENNDQQLGQMLADLENDYDWTLIYKEITKESIDKKKIIQQFQEYGPISTINIKLTQMPNTTQNKPDAIEDKLGIIKIKFLGVKNSWEVYLENNRSLNFEVEGSKLNNIFKSWFVKKQEEKQRLAQEQKEIKNQGLNQEREQENKENTLKEQQDQAKTETISSNQQNEQNIVVETSNFKTQNVKAGEGTQNEKQGQQKKLPAEKAIQEDEQNKK